LDKSQFPTPKDYCERNAQEKAYNVLNRLNIENMDNYEYLIACDTIVCIDGKILEKPATVKENLEMLQLLNGREHSVISSLYMINLKNQAKIFCGSDETVVKFHQLPLEYLQNYVSSEEGLDKAGGYGYQGLGKFLVKEIRGCYYNIVGFPMSLFIKVLIIEKQLE
jgi:septum formation protein